MSEVQPPLNVFKEGLARSMEMRIEADRVRHTKQNATDLFKNSGDVFGAGDSDKGSEVALRVLGRYERATPYKSFKDIEVACDNPNGNKKVAEADRRSVAESVFVAMNGSVLGVEGLVTDQMSAEMIDEVLPPELKGVGEFIKKIELTEADEVSLVGINKAIEGKELFSDKASDGKRGEYYSDLSHRKDAPGSIAEIYVEMQKSMLETIGIETVGPEWSKGMGKGMDKAAENMSAAADRMSEAADKMSDMFETGSERGIERGLDKGEDTPNGAEKKRFKKAMEDAMSRAGTKMEYRNLPEDKEGRMVWVEERLNMIERYKTRSIKNELALSDWMYPLQEFMSVTEGTNDDDFKEMRRMINTRLTLKAMGDALGKVAGNLDERQGLFATINELGENGFSLEPEIMEAFFGNLLEGFKTAEAWDLMEFANFHYEKMIAEIIDKGSDALKKKIFEEYGSLENFSNLHLMDYSKDTPLEGKYWNYFLEASGNKVRASIVREYMIETLKGLGIDDYHAEKSLRMAEFMYDATSESSVVNWDFINGDEYAELINTGYLRWLDSMGGKKGKKSGPPLTILRIKHMSVGWLRAICDMKNPVEMVTSKDIKDKALTYIMKPDKKQPDLSEKERGLETKKLHSSYMNSITKTKLLPAKLLVCSEETPDPTKFVTIANLKSVNDAFNKVDGDVAKKEMYGSIKTMWLAGQIQLALTAKDSKWTSNDFLKLKNMVTKQFMKGMSEQAEAEGVLKTFITKDQWKWIENHLNVTGTARADAMVQTFGDFLDRLGGKK